MSKFVLTAQLQLQAPNNVRQVVNQIQNQLRGGVNVNVNTQGSAQAQRQIQKVTNETNKATNAATRMGKAFGLSIKRFAGLAIATRAVSLFTNTLGEAVRESIAFERELIKISQVTGKTISELKDLTNTITSLSTGLGVSSSQLLKTSRILSQAGFSAREAEIALSSLAKTELAPTFTNIIDTTEGAVAIFNQFKQGAAALEAQLGSINAVAGKFAVEAGDLITVIRRTGGVFKAAGGDLNELIALFTSVRSTTRESAESIATGLKTIFTRIQRPKTIEFLRQFGVELQDVSGKFVGPTEAVRQLNEAFAGLDEGDLTFVKVGEEVAGFRQIGKIIPLIREFAVAQEALKVAQKGQDSLAENAATAQLALAVRIGKTQEKFQALIREIVGTQSFQVLANTILTLADAFIKLADAIKPILPFIGLFGAFKAYKGISSFAGGIRGGLGVGPSARGFARGGMVPGTGDRDTVPAMLTPGEFVIKKSSVKSLGLSTLDAMNNNRYNKAGVVKAGSNIALENAHLSTGRPVRITKSQTGQTFNAQTLDNLVIAIPREINQALKGKSEGNVSGHKLYSAIKSVPAQTLFRGQLASKRGGYGDLKKFPEAQEQLRKNVETYKSVALNAINKEKVYHHDADLAPIAKAIKSQATPKLKAALEAVQEVVVKRAENKVLPAGMRGRSQRRVRVGANDRLTKRNAGGGISGTDTVPALLTPGEFVVNKKSAKAIGYGSLNRMNKVGKYASGGIVRDGRNHYGVQSSLEAFQSDPSGKNTKDAKQLGDLGDEARKTSNRLQQVGLGLSIALSTLQSLLPVVNENSSALAKGTNAVLSLGLQVSVATTLLESFGVGLGSEGMKKFLSNDFGKVAAGLAGVAGATFGVISVFRALEDQSQKLAKAIVEGREAEAGRISGEQFSMGGRDVASGVGGIVGGGLVAAFAPFLGPVGIAVGAAAGASLARVIPDSIADPLNEIFTGQTKEAATSLAIAHAAAAKTALDYADAQQKINQELRAGNLEGARDEATKANESASNAIKNIENAIASQEKRRDDAQKRIETPLSGFDRFDPIDNAIKNYRDFFDKRTIDDSNTKIDEQRRNRRTQQEGLLNTNKERIDEEIRVIAAGQGGGATAESVEKELIALFKSRPGDEALAQAIQQLGISQYSKNIQNLTKSVALAREQFDALNLSLGPVRGSTGAAIVGLDNLSNNLNSDSASLTNSVNILKASTTEAAMGLSAADFEKSLDEIAGSMVEFGADEATAKKLKENARVFASASKEFPSIFQQVRSDLGGTTGITRQATSGKLQENFAAATQKQLERLGFSEEEARKVGVTIENAELSDDQRGRLRSGDVSVFQEVLKDGANKAMTPLIEAAQQAAEVQQKLIPFIKQRIEAERKLVEAQQRAIDIFMEARNFEAGFGGAPVTLSERRKSASARSNVLGRSAGLSDVDGSVESFRRRRGEIQSGFAAAQRQPGQQLTPELESQQNKLRNAQEDQVQTLRTLIKIQQDEIRTIQEKQRLEKESIDSLLSGDIDKFFEQQAAQGAIAAAATGDQRLMDAYGADATGAAAIELRRMKDAGVTEMYGQQIGGRGGLLENTALSGVRARGLRGSAAERSARIAAGTTDEQLEAEKIGRELAGELAAAGDLGADMAAEELNTAARNLNEAAQAIKDAVRRTRESGERGALTGEILETEKKVAAQTKISQAARSEATAKEESANAAMAAYNKSKYAGMSDKELLQLSDEEFNESRRMKAAAYYDKPREQAEAEKNAAEQEALLQKTKDEKSKLEETRSNTGRTIGGTAPAGASLPTGTAFNTGMSMARKMAGDVGAAQGRKQGDQAYFGLGKFFGGGEVGAAEGRRRATETFDQTFGGGSMLDPEAVSQLSDFNSQFSDTVKTLSGLGLDVNLANTSVNVNLQGGEFLKSLTENLKRELLNEIGQNLSGYRPTSTGMSNDGAVLPTS